MKDFFIFLAFVTYEVSSDMYMHTPRGGNNRLNEKSANRNNGNRLFDSQNNNRGGYNVGDISDTAFTTSVEQGVGIFGDTYWGTNGLDKGQYSMVFFEESDMIFEWTNQHGCGGKESDDPNKLNCNIVLQLMCNTDNTKPKLANVYALQVNLKNGRNTNTPDTATTTDFKTAHKGNDDQGRGRHESEAWYYECERKYRNKGLFLADQNVKGTSAKYTRQNPNGNRRGLECPEERDYYPYWDPTPWMDVAILTDNTEDCSARFNYKGESQNVKEKWGCYPKSLTDEGIDECFKHFDNATKCNEFTQCEAKGFTHGIPPPACVQAPWTRANSLGNGRDGMPTTYKFTWPKLEAAAIGQYTQIKTTSNNNKIAKCVLRTRYNISTDDYDPQNTNASHNYNLNAKPNPIVSPVTQNPTVDIGLQNLQGLRLAINTNQFGRTFQDRTHVLYIIDRQGLPENLRSNKIQNVIVRGKRGNIVQTFPAVEYDYAPNTFTVTKNKDLVHFQWTGSNTHNNGNPAGDGQAGDAGEGTYGTDRSNIVPIINATQNYILPFRNTKYDSVNLLKNVKCLGLKNEPFKKLSDAKADMILNLDSNEYADISKEVCALRMATAGYYRTLQEMSTKTPLNVLLNNAYASFRGTIMQGETAGVYHFMCSRNNNFSNRSQKGVMKVV